MNLQMACGSLLFVLVLLQFQTSLFALSIQRAFLVVEPLYEIDEPLSADQNIIAPENQQQQQQTFGLSKRAFDRLDVSHFDFDKRFHGDSLSMNQDGPVPYFPLAKLFLGNGPPSNGRIARKLAEGVRKQRWAMLDGATPLRRINGFGLFGSLRL